MKKRPTKTNVTKPNGRGAAAHPVSGASAEIHSDSVPNITQLVGKSAEQAVEHKISDEQRQELIALDQQAARMKIACANVYMQSLAVQQQCETLAKQISEAQENFQAKVHEIAQSRGIDIQQPGWAFNFQEGIFFKRA